MEKYKDSCEPVKARHSTVVGDKVPIRERKKLAHHAISTAFTGQTSGGFGMDEVWATNGRRA